MHIKARRWNKKAVALTLADIIIINAINYIMVFVHWNFIMDASLVRQLSLRIPYLILAYVGCYTAFRLYNIMWRYAGFYEMFRFGVATVIATCVVWCCDYTGMKICGYLINTKGMDIPLYFNVLPSSIYIDSTLVIIFACLFIRVMYRSVRVMTSEGKRRTGKGNAIPAKKVLIVGAGAVGSALVTELQMTDYRFGIPVPRRKTAEQTAFLAELETALKRYSSFEMQMHCITCGWDPQAFEILEQLRIENILSPEEFAELKQERIRNIFRDPPPAQENTAGRM